MATAATTSIKPPILENIPQEITSRPQWVTWREETRDGRPTKVPYIPGTNQRASTTDLMTWRTFEEAVEALEAGDPPYHGVGFVFSSGDPHAGIDLDDCRDPETGAIAEWAQKIIDRATEGYVEVSPSGRGVHIIVEGRVRDGGMRMGPIEMYSRERFFPVSGIVLR
jgi:putative DNA primase/helicase